MAKTRSDAIRAPRGTRDLLGDALRRVLHVEETACALFETRGYRRVRTPLYEELGLFVRGLGEVTDVVEKEMFVIEKGEHVYALRPEATASTVRAYLEARLDRERGDQKLYYAGPMYRYERPQKGRQREFHQVGVEALGGSSPVLDAEVIELGARVYDALGLSGVVVHLNSLGCSVCRPAYRQVLAAHLAPRREAFCGLCQARFDRNVFRLLDCKNAHCRELLEDMPDMAAHLCDACRDAFARTRGLLDAVGRRYVQDPRLVRGLDYYTRVIWEYVHTGLGARAAVGGGGRYDDLIEELGGEPRGAVGFALGVEAILAAMEAEGRQPPAPVRAGVFVAHPGPLDAPALLLMERLRGEGLVVDSLYDERGLKGQLKRADREGFRWVVVLPGDFDGSGTVRVKDLVDGGERELEAGALDAGAFGAPQRR